MKTEKLISALVMAIVLIAGITFYSLYSLQQHKQLRVAKQQVQQLLVAEQQQLQQLAMHWQHLALMLSRSAAMERYAEALVSRRYDRKHLHQALQKEFANAAKLAPEVESIRFIATTAANHLTDARIRHVETDKVRYIELFQPVSYDNRNMGVLAVVLNENFLVQRVKSLMVHNITNHVLLFNNADRLIFANKKQHQFFKTLIKDDPNLLGQFGPVSSLTSNTVINNVSGLIGFTSIPQLDLRLMLITTHKTLSNAASNAYRDNLLISLVAILLILIICLTFIKLTNRTLAKTTISRNYFNNIIRSIGDMLIVTDNHGAITSINQPLLAGLGYSEEDLIGKPLSNLFINNEHEKLAGDMANINNKETCIQVERTFLHKDGSKIPVLFTGCPIQDEKSKQTGLTCIAKDITTLNTEIKKRKTTEKQLRYLATHDALTKLPNRLQFEMAIRRVIATSKRHKRQFALLFIDLDNFKTINDTLGHDIGDLLLTEVASRLQSSIRIEDMINQGEDGQTQSLARLGGDEFAIILNEITSPNDAGIVAKRLLEQLHKPCAVAEHELHLGASIGIACYPSAGEDTTDIIKNADIAMYRAKELGRNNYQYYTEQLHKKHMQHVTMENTLRKAIENDQFYLVYQPIYALPDKTLAGMEVLLRWEHPKLGLVPPDTFIPIAEETGIIGNIFEWVLNTACLQYKAWNKDLQLTINLSARQLFQDDLAQRIKNTLNANDICTKKITFELTETSIMENSEAQGDILQQLNDIGSRIAMDDFGTGYSSLSRIKSLPIHTLKIDKSFVQDIDDDDDSHKIVSAIISLAKSLDLSIVAEGVETQEQLDFIIRKECEFAQGYLLNKPLNTFAMSRLLEKN